MAAIAPSRIAAAALFLVLTGSAPLPAQHSRAINDQLTHVATALSSHNPEEAMIPFDKSFDDYQRLDEYFAALTDSYSLQNEIDITEEQIEGHEATLTVHWIMILNDIHNAGISETREKDLTVKLEMKKYDWKIVDLSPVEFFDPEMRKSK